MLSAVQFSEPNFEMTGLLSVFSLLPIQALKKEDDGEEQYEEDSGRTTADGRLKTSMRDDGEPSDKDTERYKFFYINNSEFHQLFSRR